MLPKILVFFIENTRFSVPAKLFQASKRVYAQDKRDKRISFNRSKLQTPIIQRLLLWQPYMLHYNIYPTLQTKMSMIHPKILTRKSICQEIELRENCIRRVFSQCSEQALSSCLTFKDEAMTDDASVENETIFSLEKKCSFFQSQTLVSFNHDLSEFQFINLFQGCRDWKITTCKGIIREKLRWETEQTLESESQYIEDANKDKTIDNSDVVEMMDNLAFDYDDEEWFDTDCSEYENALVSQ